MPVLAVGGAASWGELVGDAIQLLADDVQPWSFPAAATGWPSRPPRNGWRR
jgi:hypothetical protein